jgi:protein phosphatase
MIKSAAVSDIGRKRRNNQDYYLLNSECQLYVVADGMGGHAAGGEAAKLTVTSIDGFIKLADDSPKVSWPFGYNIQISFEHNVLRTALLLANLRVCRASEESEQYAGMGSTVVVVWLRGDKALWTHLGDSRLYHLRKGELRQLTEDHTLVQEQLKLGIISPAEAKTHSFRHVITHAVGSRERVEVEVGECSLEASDLLLLCCDGLSDKLTDRELCDLLRSGQDLQATCQALVDAANRAGGDDNITAVLLQYVV